MPWTNKKNDTLERVIAGLCYLSMGLIGLLYIIITGQRDQSGFFRFHFLQSILLGILSFFLGFTGDIVTNIVGGIAGMAGPEMSITVRSWIGIAMQILMWGTYLLCLYGMIFAFLGKWAEIPFVSRLVKQQLR